MQFLWIHTELSSSHNDTQIFDLFLFEGAFLWFDIEVIFCQDVEYFMDIPMVSCNVLFLGFI